MALSGEIVRHNAAAARLLAGADASLKGSGLDRFFSDPNAFRRYLDCVMARCPTGADPAGAGAPACFRLNRESGATHVQIESLLDCRSGIAAGLDMVLLDVSDARFLEEALRVYRNEMEFFTNQHIALQTAGVIAHELRQPLAAITLFADFIRDNLSGSLSPLASAAKGIGSEAERMANYLHELTRLLQERKSEPDETFNINRLIRERILILRNDGLANITVAQHLEPELPPVRGRSVQIGKALDMLLSIAVNSLKNAGSAAGRLTVSSFFENRDAAAILIRHNAVNKDDDGYSQLLSSFVNFRLNQQGMAWAVSRSLIEACNGSLKADRQGNRDLVIQITLPVAAASKEVGGGEI